MEALTNGKWVEDTQAALGARGEVYIEAVMEFLVLMEFNRRGGVDGG